MDEAREMAFKMLLENEPVKVVDSEFDGDKLCGYCGLPMFRNDLLIPNEGHADDCLWVMARAMAGYGLYCVWNYDTKRPLKCGMCGGTGVIENGAPCRICEGTGDLRYRLGRLMNESDLSVEGK